MKRFFSVWLMLSVTTHSFLLSDPIAYKIVGLMQIRNEAFVIEPVLRALAIYTDAIVVLDDASHDHTVEIVRSLADELHIEQIIVREKSRWQHGSEMENREALLQAGRDVAGTHFILLDADEMFTAHCAQDQWLRKKLLSLAPGQVLTAPMMNLWDGLKYYRDDEVCSPMHWRWKTAACAFCDDGNLTYTGNDVWAPSGTLHVSREPANRTSVVEIDDINYGLIHFKAVNVYDMSLKVVWYMMLEYIRLHEKGDGSLLSQFYNAKTVNKFYPNNVFAEANTRAPEIRLTQVPREWYYTDKAIDYSCFLVNNKTREQDIDAWIEKYGTRFFQFLAIWDLDCMQKYSGHKK